METDYLRVAGRVKSDYRQAVEMRKVNSLRGARRSREPALQRNRLDFTPALRGGATLGLRLPRVPLRSTLGYSRVLPNGRMNFWSISPICVECGVDREVHATAGREAGAT